MLKLIRTVRRLATIRSKAPHIQISQGGWATPRPSVNVSIVSRSGAIGVYSHADDDGGNASATLQASSLSNITGLPVADLRPVATNEAASDGLTRGWHRLPRDLATA